MFSWNHLLLLLKRREFRNVLLCFLLFHFITDTLPSESTMICPIRYYINRQSIALAQLWLLSVVPDRFANKYVTLDCRFWQRGNHRDLSADFSHAKYADVRTTYIFIGSTIYTVKVYLWLLETNFSDSFYQNAALFIQRNSDENVLRWRHPP